MKFTFTGKLEEVNFKYINTVVFLPKLLVVNLPKGKLYGSGLINGFPFSTPIQYRKDGNRFFQVSAALREIIKAKINDSVEVSFAVIDPSIIELPEEKDIVSGKNEKAFKIKKSESSSQRLERYITTIKNLDSRMRHAIERVQQSRTETLQSQQSKKKR